LSSSLDIVHSTKHLAVNARSRLSALPQVRVPAWILITLLFTLPVLLSSGGMPWRQALAGAFSPPDFAQDIAAARALAAGEHPYTPSFPARHAQVMGASAQEGYPYFPHPPVAVFLFRPFAGLPFRTAALMWFLLSLGCLFVLAALLTETVSGARLIGRATNVSGSAVTCAFGLLLLWPPALYNLEKGQLSILLATLVAVAWRSLVRRRFALAGACVGGAAAVKVFPLVLGGYLLVRAPRAVVYCVGIAGASTLLALTWMGLDALPAYLQHSAGNVSYWETWPAVSYSLHGAAARVLVGGQWAEPLVHAPAVARVLVAIASMFLVGCAALVSWRTPAGDGREDARFAVWATLLVLLNPLAMGHNGVLLALPIALLARALFDDCRTWPKFAWGAGVVLASIPRQTLLWLAPPPVDPWRSLSVTALPMWGTLLLFAVAMALARHATSFASSPAPNSGALPVASLS
jgi:glycosyl transferase family 87